MFLVTCMSHYKNTLVHMCKILFQMNTFLSFRRQNNSKPQQNKTWLFHQLNLQTAIHSVKRNEAYSIKHRIKTAIITERDA